MFSSSTLLNELLSTSEVLLIRPPIISLFGSGFPQGLLEIANLLNISGIRAGILDLEAYVESDPSIFTSSVLDELIGKLASSNAAVIGFSVQCASFPITLYIARKLKSYCNKELVIGGPQTAALAEFPNVSCTAFSHVFFGSSEFEFLEYCADILKKSQNIAKKSLMHDETSRLIRDFSRLWPPFEEFHSPIYVDHARGCSHRCTFCAQWRFWKSETYLPVHSVTDYMDWCVKTLRVRTFEFTHDNLFDQPEYSTELIKAIKDRFAQNIRWIGRARVEALTDETLLRELASSGCQTMIIGIESPSDDKRVTLKKRTIAFEEIVRIVKNLTTHGIQPYLSFVVGFPDENAAQIEETLQAGISFALDKHIGVHIHEYCLLPWSGNPQLPAECVKKPETVFSPV